MIETHFFFTLRCKELPSNRKESMRRFQREQKRLPNTKYTVKHERSVQVCRSTHHKHVFESIYGAD